jgi:hypothetical protein
MATSDRKLIACKFGSRCNKGDDCQYAHPQRKDNSPLVPLPPKYGDSKSKNLANHQSRHLHSPHHDQQDYISSRVPLRSTRAHSSSRPVVATETSTPFGLGVFHPETPSHDSSNRIDTQFSQAQPSRDDSRITNNRRSNTHSRNRRPDSKIRSSNAIESIKNSLNLPLSIEQIQKNIQDLYQVREHSAVKTKIL